VLWRRAEIVFECSLSDVTCLVDIDPVGDGDDGAKADCRGHSAAE